MELKRGTWYKKYINCPEDKRDYDILRRGYMESRETMAREYCESYNIPDLSDLEKREIDEFWAHYGIKFKDYSYHRMYYHVTGIHDVKFVPDYIAGLVIYPYYNDFSFENTWRDKNMFESLLPNVPTPETYGKCARNRLFVNGKFYKRDDLGIQIFADEICKKVASQSREVIVKDARDTGFGKGVKKYRITDCNSVLSILKDWEKSQNFIIQKCCKQHPIFEKFNKSSVNIVRILSWRHDDEVDIIFATLRAGIDGAITDMSFVDGVKMVQLAGIELNGKFKNKVLNQDGKVVKEFSDVGDVPCWDKIIKIIKENHLHIDNFDIVGWDFTVDEDENPICFEWNIQWPGTVFYQYTSGPLFGRKTEEILSFLELEYNRDNYIPYYLRLK